MKQNYSDITSGISEEPKWFDENGTPRYCEFSPGCVADIYANEVCFLEIRCQACKTKFKVAASRTKYDGTSLAGTIKQEKDCYYGDPPNTGHCSAGHTMTSETLRVLEFWERGSKTNYEWSRIKELEIEVPEDHYNVDF